MPFVNCVEAAGRLGGAGWFRDSPPSDSKSRRLRLPPRAAGATSCGSAGHARHHHPKDTIFY